MRDNFFLNHFLILHKIYLCSTLLGALTIILLSVLYFTKVIVRAANKVVEQNVNPKICFFQSYFYLISIVFTVVPILTDISFIFYLFGFLILFGIFSLFFLLCG